jgi:hypothetical protein
MCKVVAVSFGLICQRLYGALFNLVGVLVKGNQNLSFSLRGTVMLVIGEFVL